MEKYCRHLSNTYRFTWPGVQYTPCCWVPSVPIDKNVTELRKEIESKVLSDPEKYCYECIRREKTPYNLSTRQQAKFKIPADVPDGVPVLLDFQIDTTCNAACVICSPQVSSLWRKQIDPNYKLETYGKQHDEILNSLDLSHVKFIQFFGGDPLASDTHIKILKAMPDPSKIGIYYSTNGSIYPSQEVLDLWDQFMDVEISFSIDDVGDRFHYIRWPLNWEKAQQNILRFSNNDVVDRITILCTINPLNAYYFDELESWVENNLKNNEKFYDLCLNACSGTWDVSATPDWLRDKIKRKYNNDHKLIALLDSHPENKDQWYNLMSDIEKLDKQRNLSSKDIFKEVLG